MSASRTTSPLSSCRAERWQQSSSSQAAPLSWQFRPTSTRGWAWQGNLQLLEDIGRAGASSALPMLLGADFNMSATEVHSSGFPQKLGCKLLEPAMGTCKGRGGVSTIDFFACELNMAKGIKKVESVLQEPFHPHRPVRLTLGVKEADFSYWAFEVPFSFPKERLIGPLVPPPKWEGLLMAVERFCDCAPLDSPSHCREAVDKAYAPWARLAELELASVTGHTVPLGRRASKPNLVGRTFRNKGPARAWASMGEARGLGWIVGMAQELESLGRGRADMAKVRNLCSCIVSNPPPWLPDLGHVGAWLRWLQGLASEALLGRGMPLGFHEDLAHLDHELGLAKSCDMSSRVKQWSDWARSALEGSAGKAHRFTRVPEAWVPTVAMGHDGKPSAAPAALLQEQRAMWGRLWQGGKRGDTRGSFTWPADAPCQSSPSFRPTTLGGLRRPFPSGLPRLPTAFMSGISAY